LSQQTYDGWVAAEFGRLFGLDTIAPMPVADTSSGVRVRVPAKVNLHLAVGSARDDGFHEVITVYQAVGLYDEITAQQSSGLSLTLAGPTRDGVPAGPQNLAWRAAQLLADHAGIDADVHLQLDKTIPVAGGMAGGSADAAATLLGCASLWRLGTTKAELLDLAAELGSDVAFPLLGGTAMGTGRGEQLTPVLATGSFHWVFAMSGFGISAAEAYAELDRLRAAGEAPEPLGTPEAVLDALRSGDCERLAPTLGNDLQAAALSLRPELGDILEVGLAAGAMAAMVSGSGPTCAFLVYDDDAAQELSLILDKKSRRHRTRVAVSPVSGARVLA
jgi:4-diphosphocytidyl-2-C-methyl-D-erythritol kinase